MKHPYHAYLVRCWREGERWRFSLEMIGSRRQLAYEEYEALVAALSTELKKLADVEEVVRK